LNKNHWICLALALLVGGLFAGLEYGRAREYLLRRQHTASSISKPARWMQRMEWAASDARFIWRGARAPHPDVTIIAIDEFSLEKVGEWPWSRGIHARLIEILRRNPPKALLFDVLFLEPFTANLAGDKALARATRNNPWVIHSMFLNVTDQGIQGGKLPVKDLLDVSERIGSVNAFPDDDGHLRSAPLEITLDDLKIPLLSLEGVSLYSGKSSADLWTASPRDARDELLVQYAGPENSFPYYSYAEVLSGKVPSSAWAGKVVLVGSRATGTYDHYPTPMSKNMPGVEFHANIIDNLLSKSSLKAPDIRWTYLWIVVFALFSGLFLARLSPALGATLMVVTGGIFFGVTQWLFTVRHVLVDLAGPLLTLFLSYMVVVIYRFFTEEKEKRWVKAAFGQYVSPKVLDVLMQDPAKLNLGGERRDMSVLFSDVAGFTSISERMTPDALVVLLNKYLSAMTEIVFKHDGYLNKYMGDGIMAFWNAPVKQVNHAELACRCALESVARLVELNKELTLEGLTSLSARIGINTGTMVVGNMGSRQKSDYTVMGDNVNLGSRLEGANKAFGSAIMISEFTYEIVQDKFDVRYLDRIRVPGKARPARTYELLAEKGQLSSNWQSAVGIFHEGIQLFTDRNFAPARNKFLEVQKILGQDKPSAVYIERCDMFLLNPPEKEWDGVFDLKTK